MTCLRLAALTIAAWLWPMGAIADSPPATKAEAQKQAEKEALEKTGARKPERLTVTPPEGRRRPERIDITPGPPPPDRSLKPVPLPLPEPVLPRLKYDAEDQQIEMLYYYVE